MQPNPPLRPTGTGSAEAEPVPILRGSSPVRTAAAIAAAAAVFLAVVVLAGIGRLDTSVPGFLEDALGPEKAGAPMERTPATGVGVRINDQGYTVSHWGVSVSVASQDVGGAEWRRHAHGVTRETEFGTETIVVDGAKTEAFLAVAKRQGEKTWRWRLASRLHPRLNRDGAVAFLDPTRHLVTGFVLDPVRILNAHGEDITPNGLRWGLEESDGGWLLTLELDDSDLPLPYVIDPATNYPTPLNLRNTPSSHAGGWTMDSGSGAVDTTTDNIPAQNATGWYRFNPGVSHTTQLTTIPTTSSGSGFFVDPVGGATGFPAGNWSFTVVTDIPNATLVAGTAVLTVGLWKGTLSGGTWTPTQTILTPTDDPAAQNLRTTVANKTTTVTFSLPAFSISAGETLFVDFWRHQTGGINSGTATRRRLDFYVNDGNAFITHPAADDTGPTHSLSVTELTNPGGQYFNAGTGTLFYNTAAGGTFRVEDAATDVGAGVASVTFPGLAATGFTHTAITDTTSPYQSNTYTWTTANTTSPGSQAVSAVDNALNSSNPSPQLTFTRDVTAPSGQTLALVGGPYYTSTSVSLTAGDGTDAGAGLDTSSRLYERDTATLTNGACGAFSGSWTTVSNPDTTVTNGNCYRYRYSIADNVGNRSATVTASVDAKIDTSAPAAPSLSLAENPADPDQHVSGTTLYYKPGANGGTFRVTATAADAQSGIASAAFPAIANVTGGGTDSSSPYEMDYTWGASTAATGSQNVTAQNNAGLTSANGPFTLTQDSTAPSGQTLALVGGPYYTSTSVSLTAGDGSDAGAGLDTSSRLYERDSATLTNGSCGSFSGSWTTVSNPDTTVVSGNCYRYRYSIADNVGNRSATVTTSVDAKVDTSAPSSTVSFPASGATYNTAGWNAGCATAGLCGAHSDGGSGVSQVQVSLRQGSGNYWNGSSFASASEVWNTASIAAGNWSYTFATGSFPADGSYTIRVRATDAAGNVETPNSRSFTIDRAAPQTTIDSNPANPTASTSATFTFSSSEGGSTFECRLDAGSWSACTSPRNYSTLADGSHTFDVRATDVAGNTDASPASYTWLVDTTAPSSTTSFPAASGEYNSSGWAAGCATAGLCGTYADGSGSGVSQVQVSIRQGSGNYWNGSSFASASEVWNTASIAAGNWSYTFAAGNFPADGNYTVRVRATDAVANVETPSSRTFTYDTTNPSALFTFPTASGNYMNSTWNAGCATNGFCGTHSDALSGVQAVQLSILRVSSGLYWNGTSFASGTETFQTAGLAGANWSLAFPASSFPADGQYTVHIRARDDAQNTESGPSRTFRIDNTAPSSTVTFPAAAGTYNTAGWNAGCGTNGLCGTQSDGGSGIQGVEVSIRQGAGNYWNGSGFSSGTEVWNTASLAAGNWSLTFPATNFPADGGYTVRVRATDVAGNVETPSSRSFTIDRAEPQTTIDSSPADPTSSTSANFTFSSSEGGSTFECRIDAGSWSACTSPKSYASLADGSHTFDVRATDAAGNTDGSPASYTWLVDTAAPSSTLSFPASAGTYNTAGWNAGCATNGFCGTYSDGSGSGVAEVEISIRQGSGNHWDGSGFTSASEVWSDASVSGGNWWLAFPAGSFPADGSYTVRVRAVDNAANTETASSRSFTIDRAAPQTTIDSNPADPTSSTSASFDLSASEGSSSFECRIDAGSWSACTSPKSYASLADGSHTFDVRATDVAGNTDGSPASFTWLVDTAAPSSTTTFPASSGSYTSIEWDVGCATAGLCGTYDDGSGAGVAEVEVSIRRGSGNYWDGSGFTSGSEVWNDSTLAAGNWSYNFDSTDFPADGDYTVRVRAVDSVGNAEAASSRTFAFDATAPTGSLTAPADGAALRGASVTVSSDSADAGSGVDSAEFQRRPAGGGAWTTIDTDTTSPYSVSWNTTPLTDGDYDLRVTTTDNAGNTFTSPTRTVTVDNAAPSTATLDVLPAAIRNGQELTGFGADATSGVDSLTYLYCAGASCTPSTPIGSSTTGPSYNVTWSGQPADGDVRVLVRVIDLAGNTLDSAVQDVLVDNTSPTGSLTAPADGAFVVDTTAVSSNSADAGSGIDNADFQRRPAGGGAWTTIGTDTSAPYSTSWDTTSLADGDYELRVITTDQAGNTFTSGTRTVTVDNTSPSVTIVAPTGYVNGGSADPFTASATSPDGDVDQVEFFHCSDATTACSGGTWVSLGIDTSAPYSASWPIDPDGNRALRAIATDGAGNTGADVVNVTIDRTDPTGSLTAPADGAFVVDTTAVSSNSADAGSGIDNADFQRRPAGGGAWTTIGTDTSAPYSTSWDTTSLADGDYELRVITTDQAGNTFTSGTRTVTVDNSAPSAPVVILSESSPFAHVSGTEVFVNTDETGSFDVEATSSDPHSGIDRIRFPGPTDDFSSPYQASYAFGDLSGAQTVTAFNRAGLTASSPFTVTPDTAEPAGGSVSYADGYDTDGSVPVAVDAGTDALSGVAPASAVLERRTAALSDGACDPFSGGWSTVTSPDTVGSGLCAQYRYRVSDRVGNEAVYSSGAVVKVDLVDPAAPVLTLVESSPFAHAVGTEIFVNTNETGSYDVQAATSDAVSGIARVAFPGGVDDTSAPYEAAYDFDDLLGTQTVTAHDRAGNTASSDFDVTEDVTAPSTADDTASIGSAWQTAPVTVTLSPSDARSGVAATYYTTDGSIPTASSDEGTSVDLTVDGVYVIRYFSVDNVGNAEPVRTAFTTIRIDQTNPSAPAIALSESSPYAHVSGSEIFVNTNQTGSYDVSATTSDAVSGIDRVSFPGGLDDLTSPYSATYDLDDLSGSQTVTAHDVAGNSASDTFTVTPDTAPPSGGFVDYPDSYDADGTVTVAVDAGSDALSGVNAASGILERRTSALSGGVCAPFVGGWSAVTSPDTVPDSTCARYRYRVSDRVGNEAIYTLPTSTAMVDLTAPQTSIDVAPADPSSDPSPAFEFSASEGGSTFECRLDGGAWSACSSPESLSGLADGSHSFQVRATDAAGLTDPTPASHAWTVDTVTPNTSFDVVPPDPSNDDAPTFEFSANETGSSFECRLDGGAWGACSSPETIGLLADGSHTFDVRAVDAAGNVDPSPDSHTWTVDTVAPDSSFSIVPADPSNDTTPTFTFSASEGGSTFQCRLDGGAWGACASPDTLGPLADGSHTFEVRATDPAGNQETTPESYTWVIDAGAPSVTITQPGGFVSASDADPFTVRATSPDGDVANVELFRCSDASAGCSTGSWVSLGTDATAPYEASWPLDPDGNRALRAVATDTASNTGTDIVDVTIDRTVPATTIDSAPSDPSPSSSSSFDFSASEGGASFECRLDAGGWGACSNPQGYVGLAEGSHTFHVRASDAAGNVDPTPATFSWTVDTLAPQTTIDAAPGDPSPTPAPSFEFSSSEPSSTFECRLDAGAWGACSSPHGYAGLADGSHTFRVRATDAAGNVDGSPATHTWTIDATPPGGGLADPGQFLRGTVALSASPSDTGVGIQSVDFQVSPANAGSWTSIDVDTTDPYAVVWDTTAVADGAYDLRIVVTDYAGNSSPSAVVEDRVVDNTAPGATMNDPGAYLRGTVSLTANATDAGSGVDTVSFQRSPAGAGAWSAVGASWNTTAVADGLYDLRVIVTDNAGNSTTSAPVTDRRVDNTRPSLTGSTPADGVTIASAGSLQVLASEDLAGIAGAEIDGAPAPAPAISGDTVTYTMAFAPGPHLLAGELEDLAGNRQPIRIHFTTWTGATADYPYVEKNSSAASSMSLRSASDTTTVTVPAGAWSGAPAGDWLVVRIDPLPAGSASGGFQPAGERLDVTAYWALSGGAVTTFSLPLEIEVDNTQAHVIPAVFEGGSWRPLAEAPGGSLPAAWGDGFSYDGTNVRILTRHLSLFALLEDVEAPSTPTGFKGKVKKGKFRLLWTAASDNSGLISEYRVYVNGQLAKTVAGSKRSVGMGAFELTDRRSFQVAAVDVADNVGPRSVALKVIPKLASLTPTAAKSALKKRGFKTGKVTYQTSTGVPAGRVIKGSVSGLRPAGSKIGLTVSKGSGGTGGPATPPPPPSYGPTTYPPPTSNPPPTTSPTSTPTAPTATPPATPPTEVVQESFQPQRGRVLPYVAQSADGFSDIRRELGFGLLAAAFSIAIVAAFRARRTAAEGSPASGGQLLLWDQRIIGAIRRFLHLS